MDRESAKSILSEYRPGETDHLDKLTLEALALAKRDPELAIWFGQHCATLAQTGGRRNPPSTSLDLEKPKLEPEAQSADPRERQIVFLRMGAAATAILAVSLYFWLKPPRPENTLANFRAQMANVAQHSFPMKTAATGLDQIREYFRTNSGSVSLELPRNLEKLPGHGAAVFTWHSRPVSLVGFDAGGKTNLYLFMAESSEMIDPPAKGKTEWLLIGRLMTACWTSGSRVYLLAGPDDEALLKAILE
jgi:hypothetical protein